MACPNPWGTGQSVGDRAEGHEAREHPDMVYLGRGAAGDRDGRPGDTQDVLQPRGGQGGKGCSGPGGAEWGQPRQRVPGTGAHLRLAYPEVGGRSCLILLDVPLHAWREPDPSPSGTFPTHQTPWSQCPQHTPPFPRGEGDPQDWVTRRWGHGHSLFSLLRTLLAIFLISAVSCSRSSLVSAGSQHVSRGSHHGNVPGNVPGKGTRDPGRGHTHTRTRGRRTHSAQGWGPRG